MDKDKIAALVIFLLLAYSNGFAADTIYVHNDIKVIVIFEHSISGYEIGREDLIAGVKQGKKILLQAQPSITMPPNDERVTNLLVWDESGRHYAFCLKYSSRLPTSIYAIKASQADYRDEAMQVTTHQQTDPHSRGTNSSQLEIICQSILGLKKGRPIAGELHPKGKTGYFLHGIYNDEQYLYFHVGIENNSGITYDIEQESFFIDSKSDKALKKKDVIKEPIKEVYMLNESIRRVEYKSEINKIYVFEKFTIRKEKIFRLEIFELHGDRNMNIEIDGGQINSSLHLMEQLGN